MYEGQLAETLTITGHNQDAIEAYGARPLGGLEAGVPSMVVIHHMPGWDEWSKEVVRKFAQHGYAALSPHLFSRQGRAIGTTWRPPRAPPAACPTRRSWATSRRRRPTCAQQPYANGKVGVIGFCSGGRQAYMAACKVDGLDAAVDCWGGRVVAAPNELNERQPQAPST